MSQNPDHWVDWPPSEGEFNMATIGEERVRIEFNPSCNDLVSDIKQRTAELINLCEAHRQQNDNGYVNVEVMRLWSLAQTEYENAAMWAVKAATYG